MKDFINGIINANGEQWFGFIFLSLIGGLMLTGLFALNADHKVRCYYPSAFATDAGIAYRIKADIDWDEDKTAYTTGSEEDMLDVLETLKVCATK